MKSLRILACLAVPSILAATAACGDPDCSVTKTCNVGGDTTSSSGGASTTTSSSAQGGAGGGATTTTGQGGGGGESAVQPGSILSQARYGGTGDDTLIELAYLSNGSLALAGHYETSIDFGGGALPSAGGNDVFVAELDAFGNETRASRFGTSDEETLCGMAVDEADGVYLYGAYDATIDIGLGPLPTSSRGQFLSRFVNGAPVWNLALESIATHRPNCRAASSQANSVFIANLYETQFSIGSSTIAGNGQQVRPAGLARITGGNPAGPSWLRKVTGLGGAWSIEPVALSADPAGNVALLVEGATQYFPQQQVKPLDVSYDGTTISGTSGLNALFRIANDGSLTWHVDFATTMPNPLALTPTATSSCVAYTAVPEALLQASAYRRPRLVMSGPPATPPSVLCSGRGVLGGAASMEATSSASLRRRGASSLHSRVTARLMWGD